MTVTKKDKTFLVEYRMIFPVRATTEEAALEEAAAMRAESQDDSPYHVRVLWRIETEG